jgi:Tfp pilus assembly protein PilV
MRRAQVRRDRGITLVEVLLASVVVGAGVAVILESISTAIRADIYADNKVKAARLLDMQLGRIEGGVLPLDAANGDFSEDGEPDFSYTVAVDQAEQANLEQITIDVTWLEHGDQHQLEAVRLYYNDPNAANANGLGSSGASGSLMGSGTSGPKGSLMGAGSSGSSGSLMGSGSGGSGGSLLGGSSSGSSGGSGSAFGNSTSGGSP